MANNTNQTVDQVVVRLVVIFFALAAVLGIGFVIVASLADFAS